MNDVAQKSNVSKSTVSQYVNKRYDYMSEETKERIKKAIDELGYVPNSIAQSLKQKNTSTIGVIVANILHSFSTEVIRAIEDTCVNHQFQMFVCNADDDPVKEENYIKMLRAKQVDGLIIFPNDRNIGLYKKLKKEKYPIVFVDRSINTSIFPTLMLDNEQALEMSVDKLYQVGRKDIGFVSNKIESNVSTRLERFEGFKQSIKEKGLTLHNDWMINEKLDGIYVALEKIWQGEKQPDALIAANDLSLMEMLKFVKDKRIHIPRDLNVISIDDSKYLDLLSPRITVIKQPTFKMGEEATIKLLQLIKKRDFKDAYEIKRFTPSIIDRESTSQL